MSVGKHRLLGELIDSDISREGLSGSSMVRSGLLRDILNEHAELLEALEGDLDWLDALSQETIERDTVLARINAHRSLIARARGDAA